ncbi:MAG: 16S rRNA (uracil(1498)-N(3))-methyltransferase [Firmicutes bacterium]|nr:16S rRNA (uracil(1498)-N(3))-methyltransferase [Bacillota bacterium]
MHRFYFDETRRENDCVRLDEEESKHALQVLRLKKDAEIVLLDGLGGVYEARIVEIARQRVTAEITAVISDNEASTRVTLYQGLPKAAKLENILQKCTEIGVHALQPVLFSRCVQDAKSAEKWLLRLRRIAREAAKQCGRGQVPMVGHPMAFAEMARRLGGHELTLVPWEEAEGPYIRDVLKDHPAREIALVIGPEGGIAPEEIRQLVAMGAKTVTLGPRILRTETAGMAALAAILTLTGDL